MHRRRKFARGRFVQQFCVAGIGRRQRAAGSRRKQGVDAGRRGRVVGDCRPTARGHRPHRRGAVGRQNVVIRSNGQPGGAVGAVSNDQIARADDGRQGVERRAGGCLACAAVGHWQSRA